MSEDDISLFRGFEGAEVVLADVTGGWQRRAIQKLHCVGDSDSDLWRIRRDAQRDKEKTVNSQDIGLIRHRAFVLRVDSSVHSYQ